MEKSLAGYSEGSFSVTRPDNGWPPGQYHLEIYIGDTLAKQSAAVSQAKNGSDSLVCANVYAIQLPLECEHS